MRNRNKDRIGERIGISTIINYFSPTDWKKKDGYFLFKCDCGNNFTRGQTFPRKNIKRVQSCGCVSTKENRWERVFKRWQFTSTSSAYRKGMENTISLDQFIKLASSNCFYCDLKPSNETRIKNFLVSGIDRIDNKYGYIPSNCVSCCIDCNFAKYTDTQSAYIERCRRVAALHPIQVP